MTSFLSSPFRPFFLLAAAYSILSLSLWVSVVAGFFAFDHVGLVWHVREMLFGFVATVMLGFLLTAGANWTGQQTFKGAMLGVLVSIWIAARFFWVTGSSLSIAAALDGLVFAAGGLKLAHMVLISRNTRNYAFPVVLFVFASICAVESYLYINDQQLSLDVLKIVFFIMMHVVLVMGGRVIPFFTDRGLQRSQIRRYPVLKRLSLVSSICFVLAFAFDVPEVWLQAIGALVALLNAVRWWTWRPFESLGHSMIWPLHLSYLLVCLGFALFAFGSPNSFVMHVFAIGGFGMMILSMISRVSLGHTGRALCLPPYMVTVFYLLLGSLILRACAVFFGGTYQAFITLSAIAWFLAYGIFLISYTPILISPRADGR